MPSITLIPLNTYAPGTYNLGPATLNSSYSKLSMVCDGALLSNPATQISLMVDLSLDSGITWASEDPTPATNPFPVTITSQGGALDPQGNPINPSFSCMIPGVGKSNRRAKGILIITNASANFSITLTVS